MFVPPCQRRLLSHSKPNLARRGFCERRAGESAARQVGGDDRAFDGGCPRGRAVTCLADGDPRRGPISPGRNGALRSKGAHDRRADHTICGADGRRASASAAGGCTLDRPDLARRVQPAYRSAAPPARAPGRHIPPGIRRAVGRPRACRLDATQPLWTSSRDSDGRLRDRRQGAARGDSGGDRRKDRRGATVRRGADQDSSGIQPPARGKRRICSRPRDDPACDPLDLAGTH